MENYLDLFLNEFKSAGTKKVYKDIISKMLAAIGKDIKDITRLDIVKYKATFEGLASATQAQRIVCIKSYFKFLYQNEIIKKNPAETIQSVRIENKPKDALTVDEAVSLMEHANAREKAIIAVFLNTGIRVAELTHLSLADYMENKHEMAIKTKGDKYRKIIFNDDTCRLIDDYLKVRKNTGCPYLFVGNQGHTLEPENLNSTWGKLARKSHIDKHVTNHTFRSTVITDIAQKYSIVHSQMFIGHANLETTRRYIRGWENQIGDIANGLRVC